MLSIAAAATSARMTMPAPPPAGVSSTFLCGPWPKSRNCTVSSDQRPLLRPLPISEMPSVPGKTSGNSVMTEAANVMASRDPSHLAATQLPTCGLAIEQAVEAAASEGAGHGLQAYSSVLAVRAEPNGSVGQAEAVR